MKLQLVRDYVASMPPHLMELSRSALDCVDVLQQEYSLLFERYNEVVLALDNYRLSDEESALLNTHTIQQKNANRRITAL
jgi:hypothetical protein